jgi:UDP-2,3-diacylglucosamine pyrophosphatase LpxH
MPRFDDTVAAFQALLAPRGYGLKATDTKVVFKTPPFGTPIFAIPDVHLCDGQGGDIFLDGDPEKPKKLAAVINAIKTYQAQHPMSSRAIQLGDWFDIWRVVGNDPRDMTYGKIQNVVAFREILDLDAQIGLAHTIGNHDAGFLNSLPDRRAAQPAFFRLGFWLGANVYALHGHQSDIEPPPNSTFDMTAVWLATVIGKFVPGVTRFESYVDRLGTGPGIGRWLVDSLLQVREDPKPPPRIRDERNLPSTVKSGQFVQREKVNKLAGIAQRVGALQESNGRSADVIIVGHSHVPGAAWTDISGKPVVVVDAGAWAYDQANILLAADDTIAVFDVTRR